jgi:protein-S-isoprenylcysteine O-methyltransferase Ste14
MKKYISGAIILVSIQFVLIIAIGLYTGIFGSIFTNILMLLGIILGLWAVITMKFNVSALPDVRESQRLFINGPYKYIRHPMYLAVLMTTLAWALNRLNWISVVLWLILFCDLLIKINYEEKKLIKHFPEYGDYKKKVKALIPFIW